MRSSVTRAPGVDPQRLPPKARLWRPPWEAMALLGRLMPPLPLHFGEAVLWPVGHLGLTGQCLAPMVGDTVLCMPRREPWDPAGEGMGHMDP